MKKSVVLSLTLALTLAACGVQPTPETQTQTGSDHAVTTLQGNSSNPALLANAEEVPQALGQLMGLSAVMKSKFTLSAQSAKAVNSLDVYNPNGTKIMRVVVYGPQKVDLLSGQDFDISYTFAYVGANAVQDRTYLTGKGSVLSSQLKTTLNAIGGSKNVKQLVSADVFDIIVQTKKGELYLLGETTPMNAGQLAFARDQFAALTKAYQDNPENFEYNKKLWNALAGTDGQVSPQSLQTLTSTNLGQLTDSDGNLNLERAFAATQGKLSAQSGVKALSLTAQAADGYYYFNNYRSGNYLPIPSGGQAQDSRYWGDVTFDSAGNMQPTLYNTHAFYSSWNSDTYMNLIGCGPSAAQALIMHRWMSGYTAYYKGLPRSFSPKSTYVMYGGENRFANNWEVSTQHSFGQGGFSYTGLAYRNDDNELVPYKLLNEKLPGDYNFSVVAMNAGYDQGGVSTKTTDIGPGLQQMLGKVWPYMAGGNNVWYEYKVAGSGSNGTMREILAQNLPAGRVVISAFPTGGTFGHVDTVVYARLSSYPILWWRGEDAYINTHDYRDVERLVTGYNVSFSGVYSVNY